VPLEEVDPEQRNPWAFMPLQAMPALFVRLACASWSNASSWSGALLFPIGFFLCLHTGCDVGSSYLKIATALSDSGRLLISQAPGPAFLHPSSQVRISSGQETWNSSELTLSC